MLADWQQQVAIRPRCVRFLEGLSVLLCIYVRGFVSHRLDFSVHITHAGNTIYSGKAAL